ncbi:MAG: LLM class F420-dependent oxidoreductase [Acidimicrobiales bacterium]
MRVGLQVDYGAALVGVAERVVELEAAGLDTVWVPEAYGYDAATLMGYLAARTSTVRIGSAILPLYSRTPALIAQTAAGLDHLSGGRAVLGLGSSGPQVVEGWHGVAYDHPVARAAEVMRICRMVWRREPLVNDGFYPLPFRGEGATGLAKPIKLIAHPERERIPIYLAALGPRNVELAAAEAEGWMPFLFMAAKAAEVWGKPLAAGAARRDATMPELQIVMSGTLVAMGEGLEELRELARPVLALYIGGMGAAGRNFYNDLVSRYGFEKEAATIQGLYLEGHKLEAAAAVPAGLVEATTLVGPEGYLRERVAELAEAGVTEIAATFAGPAPESAVAKIKEWG